MTTTDRNWPSCACGCGEPVPARKANDTMRGFVKGEPCTYVAGHVGRTRRNLVVDGHMKCSTCKGMKPVAEFSRNRSRETGLHAVCKPCVRFAGQEFRRKHRDRETRRVVVWQQANPDRQRETMAAYRIRHGDRLREEARIHSSARRAQKRAQFVEHVIPLVVLERDDGECGICGEDVDPFDFHIDHIMPLIRGRRAQLRKRAGSAPVMQLREERPSTDL